MATPSVCSSSDVLFMLIFLICIILTHNALFSPHASFHLRDWALIMIALDCAEEGLLMLFSLLTGVILREFRGACRKCNSCLHVCK